MRLQDVFGVEVGAAVAEKAPFGAIACGRVEIELMNQHAFFFVAEARDQLAFVVGDEGVAVIALDRAVVFLHADAVCGDDGDGIGNGVALHRPLPLQMRVEGRVLRLADAGEYPDGLAYDPVERRVFVSDESGGVEAVFDEGGKRVPTSSTSRSSAARRALHSSA